MRELERMFEDLNKVVFGGEVGELFPMDILEIENGYEVLAELPGIKKENIDITFEKGNLTISAIREKKEGKYLINERVLSKYKRTISLGDIKEDTISAKLEDGILRVVIIVKKPEDFIKKNIIIE